MTTQSPRSRFLHAIADARDFCEPFVAAYEHAPWDTPSITFTSAGLIGDKTKRTLTVCEAGAARL